MKASAILLLVAGCAGARGGSSAGVGPAPADSRDSGTGTGTGTGRDGGSDPFPALAARGATIAPLMKEMGRFSGSPPIVTADRDLCVRVVLHAEADIDALVAAADGPRGGTARGRDLVVPPTGPACARRGETLRLVVASEAAAVSASGIVYASP